MSIPRIIFFASALLVCFVLSVGTSRADTLVTLNAIDSGWYRPSGLHDAANDNYIAGKVSSPKNFGTLSCLTCRVCAERSRARRSGF